MEGEMKRSLLVGALLVGAALGSGCTSWAGKREMEAQHKNISLTGPNFRVVKSKIQASASCSYLFPMPALTVLGIQLTGAGGIALGNPELYEQAYRKLREQAAMEGKAAQLMNICEENTLTSYIVIGDLKLTLTADVVEFVDKYPSPHK